MSLSLETVSTIKLDDPALQEELNRALTALVGARDQGRKPLEIHFNGTGERRVRLGVRRGNARVEGELPARAARRQDRRHRQGRQGVAPGLGHGGQPDRQRLEQRQAEPRERAADFVPAGLVSTAVRAPSAGGAGAVCFAPPAGVRGRGQGSRSSQEHRRHRRLRIRCFFCQDGAPGDDARSELAGDAQPGPEHPCRAHVRCPRARRARPRTSSARASSPSPRRRRWANCFNTRSAT